MKIHYDSETFGKEIKESRFIDYPEYCEVSLLTTPDEDSFCYRCNKPLPPLTYLDQEFYHLPCWNCASKRKQDREAITGGIQRNIHDYFNKIIGDRYFQLFIVDDIYFKTTLPHSYSVFKKVVNSIDPPSRNDIWFLDWIPGYPKIISMDNLQGLKTVNLTGQYDPFVLGKNKISIGDYEILMPEISNFEPRHHSRYSILNRNGDRKTKRLRMGDKCIKFYNTDDPDIKSIFKVLRSGEEITVRSLTYQDYVILKLAIMRNKPFLRLVFDIVEEIIKTAGTFRDTVFMKNTIVLNPDEKTAGNTLTLLWNSLGEYKIEDNINISIL